MIYGYARVSTRGQERDGNSIEDQEKRLRAEGCGRIFRDSYTGTKMDRPGFAELLRTVKRGDKIVVTKLDRFARNTAGGIETIQGLLQRGVMVHILNMGLIDDTPTGKLMVTMLLAFAEFERDMIVERTRAGKAVARETKPGYKEGRKRKELDEGLFMELREKNERGEKSVWECCKELGISKGTWYSRVNATA